MNASLVRRLKAIAFCTVILSISASDPRADESAAPGDLWQIVSRMSMEGMNFSMPAQRMQVCAPKEWKQPPGGDNPERGCTSSEMARDPDDENVVTWTSVCADGMSGTGRIVLDGDHAYTGELHYSSEDGNIVIKLEGHVIGDCDNPQ
jgi:hypothetical protein